MRIALYVLAAAAIASLIYSAGPDVVRYMKNQVDLAQNKKKAAAEASVSKINVARLSRHP